MTRYNEQGWIVESRDPGSAASGTGAGVSRTSYYSVGSQTGADASCGGSARSAAWAGLTCRTWRDDASLPVAQVTEYSRYLAPATTTETQGAAVRTSSTAFDEAGRPTQAATTLAGVSGSTPVSATTTTYDPATALVTGMSAGSAGAITHGYDLWGRQTSYTDTDGAVTTTVYDAAGRVASVADPTGKTAYAYDGVGERRGLVTALTVSGVGTFTSTYDADANPVTSTLAGKVTQTNIYDRAGQRTALRYATGAGALAAWSMGYDVQGRVAVQSGPSAGHNGREQSFIYDGADRLTVVKDEIDGVCATRTYRFSVGGNRLSKMVDGRPYEDACHYGGVQGESSTWSYDGAGRVQSGGRGGGDYTYDALGRQTGVPGVDTPAGWERGPLAVGYFDNDLARSITQGDVATTFTLDAAQRRASQTTVAEGSVTTIKRHYTDSSDNPGWATTSTDDGAEVVTRYVSGVNGELAASVTGSTVTLGVVDPLGSVATTLTLDGTSTVVGALGMYDEYGNALSSGPSTGAIGYGWLGGKERATDSSGLVLMGVRLHNSITGLFTSVDPVEGGNETPYGYPSDPVNKLDLDGRSWLRRLKGAGSSVVKWGIRNRGTIASLGATAGCAIPAVGWASCAALQAGAYAVRAEQRGLTKKNLKANLFDGVATAAGFGLISTPMRMAKYGRMGSPIYNSRGAYAQSWHVGKKAGRALSVGVTAPYAFSKSAALRRKR